MQRNSASPKDYLADVGGWQREKLDVLRKLIRQAAPKAAEEIKHGMLSYDLDGDLCFLAAQKQYVSLYMSTKVVSENAHLLGGLNCGKSCIRFKAKTEVPQDSIKKLLLALVNSPERGCE